MRRFHSRRGLLSWSGSAGACWTISAQERRALQGADRGALGCAGNTPFQDTSCHLQGVTTHTYPLNGRAVVSSAGADASGAMRAVSAGPAVGITTSCLTDSIKEKSMFNFQRKEVLWGGRKLILEAGRIARPGRRRRARHLWRDPWCSAPRLPSDRQAGNRLLPLTVNFQEKTFAAGSFRALLQARRPADRKGVRPRASSIGPIRPLFAQGFATKRQVICTAAEPRSGKTIRLSSP